MNSRGKPVKRKPCEHCGYKTPEDYAPIVHTFDGCIARLKKSALQERESLNAEIIDLEEALTKASAEIVWLRKENAKMREQLKVKQ